MATPQIITGAMNATASQTPLNQNSPMSHPSNTNYRNSLTCQTFLELAKESLENNDQIVAQIMPFVVADGPSLS